MLIGHVVEKDGDDEYKQANWYYRAMANPGQ